ncbi:MAG: hypothetical protein KGI38_11485 [Thaumarchaeota archaeon]|nr:hypothetical protein [Nitrososphaerota archaeon]
MKPHLLLALSLLGIAALIVFSVPQGQTHASTPSSTGAVKVCGPDTYGDQWMYQGVLNAGFMKIASSHCILSTQRSASFEGGMNNFTSGACDSTTNTAWTIGFGPSNGNFTHLCYTLPTAADYYVDANSTSGKAFNGNIYYATALSYLTGIPYTNAGGKVTTVAPSNGYAAVLDLNVGGLPLSLKITQMLKCYITAAPTYNGNLLQLTFTPTVGSSQCNVAIDPGTLGQPYYVQIGANVITQGSGWSWTGSKVLVNSTAANVNYVVSWAPLAVVSPPPCCGGQVGVATTTVTTVTVNNSTTVIGLPPPSNPSLSEQLGVQFIVILIGGILLAFIFVSESYKRESDKAKPYVTIAIGAVGAYLLLDLSAWILGFATTINNIFPLIADFTFIGSPVEAWLQSLGPGMVVPVLAGIFAMVGGLPYLLPWVGKKLDEVS